MKKIILLFIVTGILVGMVTACGYAADGTQKTHDTEISQQLTFDHSETLDFAQKFSIDRYQDDYALVTITDDSRYLVVPEEKVAPDDLDPDIVVIQQPVQNIYLAASAAMDMFVSLDALDSIRFSSLKADGWYIDEAKQAMEAGDILYAGKYSTPDYEKIVEQNCGLAIENTMILHTPEVKEQLEKFGIHVLVDYSSYEPEPLGRTEWVKLYGLLTGHEAQADKAFAEEKSAFEDVKNSVADEADQEPKTVAFFYITSNGQANVRSFMPERKMRIILSTTVPLKENYLQWMICWQRVHSLRSSRLCRKGMFTAHQRICISQQCRLERSHRISAGC